VRRVRDTLRCNLTRVERFVQRLRAMRLPALTYHEGELHWFSGRQYPLVFRPQSQSAARVRFEPDRISIESEHLDRDRLRRLLQSGYRQQAKERFRQRLDRLLERAWWTGAQPVHLALRRMRRTWGTCSKQRVVRLNTHLIKAPAHCLDYIISHELCHLQEMHHGPAFHRLMDAFAPGWQAPHALLRRQGRLYLQE